MVFRTLYFPHRKPGTTPAEFRTAYEQHMALAQSLAGPHFPLSHVRHYLATNDSNKEKQVLAGSQADFPYDAVVEMTFADEAAHWAFAEVLQRPENAARIAADEERFLDRSKVWLVVVGEMVEQKPGQ